MNITNNRKKIVGILLGFFAVTGITLVYAITAFSGTIGVGATVTSTTTPANIAISTVQANGVVCTITPKANEQQTITCPGATIGQGGSFAINIIVTNSGGTSGSATATPSIPLLAGATFALTAGTATQTVPASGTATWTFTYTAGSGTGSDSNSITISGTS